MLPATSERNFTPSSTALSGPPSTSPGIAVVGQIVTTSGGDATARLSALVALWTGLLASLTCTVKLKTPAPVGDPVITPSPALSIRPEGRDPLATDQLYGKVPPLAASVVE